MNENTRNHNAAKANTNCLDGMRCPRCGSFEPFKIHELTANAVVYDTGHEEVTGIAWEDDAECLCQACEFRARVREFKDDELETSQAYRVTVLAVPEDPQEAPIRLGSVSVDVQNVEEARRLGVEQLWDCRLDSASCAAATAVQEEQAWEFVITPFEDFDLEEVRS